MLRILTKGPEVLNCSKHGCCGCQFLECKGKSWSLKSQVPWKFPWLGTRVGGRFISSLSEIAVFEDSKGKLLWIPSGVISFGQIIPKLSLWAYISFPLLAVWGSNASSKVGFVIWWGILAEDPYHWLACICSGFLWLMLLVQTRVPASHLFNHRGMARSPPPGVSGVLPELVKWSSSKWRGSPFFSFWW